MHRIGRTGRAGRKGIGITLVAAGERLDVSQLDRQLRLDYGPAEDIPSVGRARPTCWTTAPRSQRLVDAGDRRLPGADSAPDYWHWACRSRRESCTRDQRLGLVRITEITVGGGERYRVDGDAKDTEAVIVDAARGSLMNFAWVIEAETGERVGLNPHHVVMLRSSPSFRSDPQASN